LAPVLAQVRRLCRCFDAFADDLDAQTPPEVITARTIAASCGDSSSLLMNDRSILMTSTGKWFRCDSDA
jgi:hypothetical protein